MRRAFASLSLLFVLFTLIPLRAHSQVATGTPPFGSFGGGPDVVNLANLNSHITIPVLNKPGRGTGFTYDLTYDTSVWTRATSSGTTSWQPTPNWGFVAMTEVTAGELTADYEGHACMTFISLNNTWVQTGFNFTYFNWTYVDQFGIQHPFNAGSKGGWGTCGGVQITTQDLQATATDGSGYTIATKGGPQGDTVTITSRSGAVIHPPINSANGTADFTDRNGNQITVNASGQFFDTLSSTTPVLTVAGAAPSNTTFTYPAPSGANAVYTMSYRTYTVQTNFGCSGITEFPATSESLVDRITLPDATFYQFTYELTRGSTTNVTGRLASVTLPTGGTILYAYSGGTNGIECPDGSTPELTRTTLDGTWNYTRTGTIPASGTIVTDPQGNQTVLQFQGIYETQRMVYQGSSASGTLLRTVNTCYNGASIPCTSTAVTLPITQRDVRDQIGGTSGPQCQHAYKYNSFGVLTEQDDFDYGASAPGALLRKEIIAYAPLSNGIVDQPSSVTIQNAAGATVAQTTFTYDEGTPTATSGTPQHGTVSGARGNLTSVSQLVAGSTTLTSHATYYDTGTVNTSTDVNGAVTTFNYSSASCGNSFPTSISEPLSMSRSFAWNCTGGVQTSVTDENGKQTFTNYTDPDFWRPSSTNFPDGGQTSIAYNSPTSVTATTKMNSTQNIVGTVLLDALGRTKQTQLNSDPQGADYTDTAYDSLGRVASVSNPHRTAASSTDGTTTYGYDALNRPTSVTLQDGSVAHTSYTNNTITTTDPAGKKRQTNYDSLGRTLYVFEDPSGLNYQTSYTSDALGNLTSVVQNGSRNRTFAYDGLSRLTSETTPEAGTIAYRYDENAHASDLTSRVAPAPNQTGTATVTTSYAYDLLHRLTQKSYNDGSTPAANFLYDTSAGWANPVATQTNIIGRLSLASLATNPQGEQVFGYDAVGRVVTNNQCTPTNCGAGNFPFTYTYDLAGNMTSYTIPAGPTTFTQSFDTAGRITQITASPADTTHPGTLATVDSTLGFYPNGAIRKITFGNGLTQANSVESRLQPCRINLNSSGALITDICQDGPIAGTVQDFTYAYGTWGSTNNGNITIMAAGGAQNFGRTFSYDTLNRLATTSDSNTAQACRGLSWTYDAWGNRTDQTQTSGTCGQFHASVNTQNQLVDLVNGIYKFDAAGNLTNDGNHTYTYDAENRLIKVDGGTTATYVYDALGRRVRKAGSALPTTLDYVYDLSGNVVSEFFTSSSFTGWGTDYVYLNGQSLVVYKNNTTYFVHKDHLGSTRLVSGLDKSIGDNLDFLPFGEQISGPAPSVFSTSEHRFTGDERDSETSLDHTLFRQYSSQLGRWTVPDPAGLAAVDPSNPQSWNRYSYVNDDPLDFSDPWGLDPQGSGCGGTPTCVIVFTSPGGPTFNSGGGGGSGFKLPCRGFLSSPCISAPAPPPPPVLRADPDWFHSLQALCLKEAAKEFIGGLVLKKEIDAGVNALLGDSNAIPQAITPGSVALGAERGLEHVAESRPLIITIRTALSEEGWKVAGNAIARTAKSLGHAALGLHLAFAGKDGVDAYNACTAN